MRHIENKDRDFIVENYGVITAKKISELLNLSEWCVKRQAKKLGLKSNLQPSSETISKAVSGVCKKLWSEEEDAILREKFLDSDINLYLTRRTLGAINRRRRELGLKIPRQAKAIALSECQAPKLSLLLEETTEAYYWIGFLLADGHFTKNRVTLSISIRDKTHLNKLVNFLGMQESNIFYSSGKCAVHPAHRETVQKIIKKFDISSRKTYEPPIFKVKNEDLLFALYVGFIDGDGYVSDKCIQVKCHSSWLNFLNDMGAFFNAGPAYINNAGYALIQINKKTRLNSNLVKIKKRVIELNLPVLERKWNKITF